MSQDQLTEFLKSIAHDKEIIGRLVSHATERGFDFTAADLEGYLLRLPDLDSIADAPTEELPPGMLNI
jgi:hypothetical protein